MHTIQCIHPQIYTYLDLSPLSVLHQNADEEVWLPREDGESPNGNSMVVWLDGLDFNVTPQSVVLADELSVPEYLTV